MIDLIKVGCDRPWGWGDAVVDLKLFDAEYKFMAIIWEREPINSTELVKIINEKLGWQKSTTYTMIKKLSEKGLLQNENAMVRALVKREEVQNYESEALLEKSFDGSLPLFIATFLQSKKLSKKEAEEIQRMVEEATK